MMGLVHVQLCEKHPALTTAEHFTTWPAARTEDTHLPQHLLLQPLLPPSTLTTAILTGVEWPSTAPEWICFLLESRIFSRTQWSSVYLLKEISMPALSMTGLSYLVFVFSFLIVRDLSLFRVLILYQINLPTTAFFHSVGGLLDFLPPGPHPCWANIWPQSCILSFSKFILFHVEITCLFNFITSYKTIKGWRNWFFPPQVQTREGWSPESSTH